MEEKHFLVPVEAVAESGEGRMTIEPGKEKVVGSPIFDTNVVPSTTDHQRDVHATTAIPILIVSALLGINIPGGGVGRW